jgi:hypothetical protein
MMNPLDVSRAKPRKKSNYVMPLAIGFGAFVVGLGVMAGVVKWQEQQAQLAEMSKKLHALQTAGADAAVTRNAPSDLLSVAPNPTAQGQRVAPTQVAAARG